jgi:hypothetical protein
VGSSDDQGSAGGSGLMNLRFGFPNVVCKALGACQLSVLCLSFSFIK